MWPGDHNLVHNLIWEATWRVLVIAIVCIFQLKVPPRIYSITETEFLSHYKKPRVDSYIPAWAIVIIVVFIPLLVIYIVFVTTRNYVDTIQAMLTWTLALTINAVITESLKLIVGRPRPDFFYRCFPNGKMTPGLRCTGSIREVLEGRKSFPSGHSSFSFCSLGFLSIWIRGKLGTMSIESGHCCRVLSCLTPLVVAGIVAISRFYDNHHHWGDIIFGAILGLASSYYSYHRYYFPIDSPSSGEPLTPVTDDQVFESFNFECCTRNLNDDLYLMLNLNNKNYLESNKKVT